MGGGSGTRRTGRIEEEERKKGSCLKVVAVARHPRQVPEPGQQATPPTSKPAGTGKSSFVAAHRSFFSLIRLTMEQKKKAENCPTSVATRGECVRVRVGTWILTPDPLGAPCEYSTCSRRFHAGMGLDVATVGALPAVDTCIDILVCIYLMYDLVPTCSEIILIISPDQSPQLATRGLSTPPVVLE